MSRELFHLLMALWYLALVGGSCLAVLGGALA